MIKVYIKAHEFNLPINHDDLLQQIKETVSAGEELPLPFASVRIPLTKIEGNDYLKVEKQKTNIFLLNFLLLILEKENKSVEREIFCNTHHLIDELNQLTNLNLDSDQLEKVEKSLLEFLDDEKEVLPYDLEQSEQPKESEENNILSNVTFSMAWVKEAHSKMQEVANSKEKEE